MAHPSASPSQTMCLVTYSPRADVDAHGYDDWVRQVESPFVMSQPGIVWHESWKVHAAKNGFASFRYFDFVFIESEDALAELRGNPRLQEFADAWTQRWGRSPRHPDRSVNYHLSLCTEIAGQLVAVRSDWCLLVPYVPRPDAHERGYDEYLREVDNPFFNSDGAPDVIASSNWRIVREVLGHEWFTDIDVFLVDGPEAFARHRTNPTPRAFAERWAREWGSRPEDGLAANAEVLIGELIASPLQR